MYILDSLVDNAKDRTTNFGVPERMPQFKDAHELMKRIKQVPGLEYRSYNDRASGCGRD